MNILSVMVASAVEAASAPAGSVEAMKALDTAAMDAKKSLRVGLLLWVSNPKS